MFHRARQSSEQNKPDVRPATSAREPYRKVANIPLSPKRDATLNIKHIPPSQSAHKLCSIPNQQHILLQASSSKKQQPAVFYNEDDFDDDLDLNFEVQKSPRISIKSEQQSSQAVSWPPSSYVQKGDDFIAEAQLTSSAIPTATIPYKASKVERAIGPHDDCTPPPRKKRILPWDKPSQPIQRPGVQIAAQSRAITTSAQHVELEQPEDDEPVVIQAIGMTRTHSRDPALMSRSAVKAAIKDAKLKKRATADNNANQLKLGTQQQAKAVAQVFLSKEQRDVIELIKKGKSVFFTGSAGTGKSVLLREAIKELKAKLSSDKVAVTASTGLAACNIGGITLHSFAGVGLAKESVADLVKKVKKVKKNVLRWTKTKVLIIDEISMVDAELYDKLEAVARTLHNNGKPWGGIQIVATGDFFQLPPVPDRGKISRFSFEAEKWKFLDHTIQLKTVFRQRDEGFVLMLNQMRTGQLNENTIKAFKLLARAPKYEDGMAPTELFPTRDEVERANATRMSALPGNSHTFQAEDSGQFVGEHREKMLNNCMAPKSLELKRGAQVMLIKNRDETLVNGSLGVVVGFMNERSYTFATDDDGEFNEDMLRDSPWTDAELAEYDRSPAAKRKLIKIASMQLDAATSKVWPVVRFKVPGNRSDVHQLMSPESWKFEAPGGEVQACRKQVPLILAYAISIHKAQGQTIERVKVDLGRVFEKGQAYVALSRAVSQDGLQVLRFDPKKVMAHPKVAAFYRELSEVSSIAPADATEEPNYSIFDTHTKAEDDKDAAPMTTQEVFEQIKRDPLRAFPHFGARNKF